MVACDDAKIPRPVELEARGRRQRERRLVCDSGASQSPIWTAAERPAQKQDIGWAVGADIPALWGEDQQTDRPK